MLVIIYDLGLHYETKQKLQNLCNMVIRRFNFTWYPKQVLKWKEYRWKPLIITVSNCQFISFSIVGGAERTWFFVVYGLQYCSYKE